MLKLVIALFLLLPIQVFAVSTKIDTKADQKEIIDHDDVLDVGNELRETQTLLNTQQLEIIRLGEQLSVVREYNDDFIAVILWSLGVLLALTIVLLGFNWFQNSRAIKRELGSIKIELESAMALSKQELKHEIETELEELEELLDEKAEDTSQKAVAPLIRSLNMLKHKVLMLEYDALEAEVKRWKSKSVLSNALRTSAELIACAIKIGWDWKLSNAIDLMNEVFDSIDAKGVKDSRIDAQDVVDTEAIVETCPSSHKSLRDALLARLRALH